VPCRRWPLLGASCRRVAVVAEDYVSQGRGPDGAPTDVPLSELFEPAKDSLVIYSTMFPRRRAAGSRKRSNSAPAAGRRPVPVVHGHARSARRRRRTRLPAHQPCRGGEVSAVADRELRAGARLEAAAAVVGGAPEAWARNLRMPSSATSSGPTTTYGQGVRGGSDPRVHGPQMRPTNSADGSVAERLLVKEAGIKAE
jgi:hypothetical protein